MSLIAYCIDSPQASTDVSSSLIQLKGWVVTDHPVEQIEATELHLKLALQPRPDVQSLYPAHHAIGFCHYVNIRSLPQHVTLNLQVWEKDGYHSFPLAFKRPLNGSKASVSELLFFYNCDKPTAGILEQPTTLVAGWIAYLPASKLANIRLEWAIPDMPSTSLNELINRPDVEKSYPGLKAVGFNGLVPVLNFLSRLNPDLSSTDFSLHAHLCFSLDGVEQTSALTFTLPAKWGNLAQQIQQQQPHKLARLRPLLQCPICQSSDLEDTPIQLDSEAQISSSIQIERSLRCKQCNALFPSDSQYNFLSPELRVQGAIEDTENISSLPYAAAALRLIESLPDGLILDNGAGFRDYYYPNVVNFEIAAYPTTDVLGIGERLPFQDGVFDAVLSSLVLEHVRDPFQCAAEIARVLKPGGKLYCAAPLMQPFHGYPNHYYNATLSGLTNLFESHLKIIESGVCPEEYGHPLWALCWMLNSYVRGLSPNLAEEFKQLKVTDFLLADPTLLLSKDFALQLSEAAKRELACTNFLIAVKP